MRIQPTIGGRAFEHRVFGDNLMAFTVNVMSTEAGLWLSLFAPSHASRTGESFTASNATRRCSQRGCRFHNPHPHPIRTSDLRPPIRPTPASMACAAPSLRPGARKARILRFCLPWQRSGRRPGAGPIITPTVHGSAGLRPLRSFSNTTHRTSTLQYVTTRWNIHPEFRRDGHRNIYPTSISWR